MATTIEDRAVIASDSVDDLDQRRAGRRARRWTVALGVGIMVTLPVAVGVGPSDVAPLTVMRIVCHHMVGWPSVTGGGPIADTIVWQIRMPRVLLGAVVGAGLAIAGTALQAMVRNVLADPSLLGVTAGASTGAAATILFGVGGVLGGASLG